jgi:rhodanese-related sulfurtransferase
MKKKIVLGSFIFLTSILPVVLYLVFISGVKEISSDEAKKILASDNLATLVDVRDRESFRISHIDGSINLPLAEIKTDTGFLKRTLPDLDGKTLLICGSGIQSVIAARDMQSKGYINVYSIKGGIQMWSGMPGTFCPLKYSQMTGAKPGGYSRGKDMSVIEKAMLCVAGFGIKPLYMFLSFVIIIVLWKSAAPDLAALKWAMIFFLTGESFCAANYLFFGEDSLVVEYLHIAGMVWTFAFTVYAILEGVDNRIIRYSEPDKRCALIGLCGDCIKYGDYPCRGRQVGLLLVVFMAVLTSLPLLAYPYPEQYSSDVFGTFYRYAHLVIFQLFESKYAPVMALLLYIISFVMLFRSAIATDSFKVVFSAASGFLGFSIMRTVLFALYRQDNLWWFTNMEEITELMFIAGVASTLYIFRKRLF